MRERRQNRSNNVTEALSLLLGYRKQARGSDAVVIGTTDGLLLGASPGTAQAELMAAFGAARAAGKDLAGAPRLSAAKLFIDGLQVVLTTLGGPPLQSAEFEADVGRILRCA
jgi:hypothetical protein